MKLLINSMLALLTIFVLCFAGVVPEDPETTNCGYQASFPKV